MPTIKHLLLPYFLCFLLLLCPMAQGSPADPGRMDQPPARLTASSQEVSAQEQADTARKEGERLVQLRTKEGLQAAIQSFSKAAQAYHKLGDLKQEGYCLDEVGEVYYSLGLAAKALEYYQQALPLRRQAGDRDGEAYTLHNIGVFYFDSGQAEKSLPYFEQALPLEQQAGDQWAQANTLISLGLVYGSQPTKAAGYFQQALILQHQLGDKAGEIRVLQYLEKIYSSLDQLPKALEFDRQLLSLQQEIGDQAGKADTLQRIGLAYWSTGQPQQALQYYQQALPLFQKLKDTKNQASVLTNTGLVYDETGQPQKALECYEQALPLSREAGDKGGQAAALLDTGVIYVEINQLDLALQYLGQAVPLYRQTGDKNGVAYALNVLGVVLQNAGQFQNALPYLEESSSLQREVGDKKGEAYSLTNLGNACSEMGRPQKAMEYYQQALPLYREIGYKRGEAAALHCIGTAYMRMGEPRKALQYLEQSLPLDRQVGSKNGEAITLKVAADVLRGLGQTEEARTHYEQAIEVVNSLVGTITRDDLKRSTSDYYQFIYSSYIDFLLTQGQSADIARAVEVSEMARSRALRDLLAGNTSQLPSSALSLVSHHPSGAGQQHSAKQSANAAANPLSTSGSRQFSSLARMVEDLPSPDTTGQAERFRIAEAKTAAADGPVVLFHLLDHDLAIFVVEPSGVLHAARSPIQPVDLLDLIQETTLSLTANDDPAETRASLRKLYDALIKPVEPWLGTGKAEGPGPKDESGRNPAPAGQPVNGSPAHPYTSTSILTLVPFGPLFQVPFAALQGSGGHYLVEQWALRTVPSLTVLRLTHQRSLALKDTPSHPALYGDPVMPPGWSSLPGALEEVEKVTSTMRAMGASPTDRTRAGATEADFRAEAPGATEIHLATHGYVNNIQPRLSGIVLAPSSGKEPAYQRDGYLTVAEVFQLKLNARLVTLSGCETGLGATSADGVFGLQSAFLSAGSASLLSSLWSINDNFTSTLMQQFYHRLEIDHRHNRATALQQAQLSLLHSPLSRAPVFWAGFVLTGESK